MVPIAWILLLPLSPWWFCFFYFLLSPNIVSWSPVQLGSVIGFGGKWGFDSSNSTFPCKGLLNTFGLFGSRNWSGNFYGHIPIDIVWLFYILPPVVEAFYPGVVGFTGLRIEFENDEYPLFLIGSALQVKVGSDIPNNPWMP